MKLTEIIEAITTFAPLAYQESYDNCGLQVGDTSANITAALVTLDVTEAVIEEAIARNANLVIAHHPLIFSGLKSITGKNYVERTLLKAIKNDIHIYAAHTNLDNVHNGVNKKIADKIGLIDTRVLSPKPNTLYKLCTYAPLSDAERVRNALFAAGAGSIGQYSECSFNNEGHGTFKPHENANPTIGIAGGAREWVPETKIEVIVAQHLQQQVIAALLAAHPYEEVAYEVIAIGNLNKEVGAGIVGLLPEPMPVMAFFELLKTQMKTQCIKYTALSATHVHKIALCGGSGSFLLKEAISSKADIFITSDYKYHQFFDAENRIMIADIGHFETEQYTPEIFKEILREKFPNFAVLLSNTLTNPVNYFC